MSLEKYFDVVIFLTWSDWHTEPRSNRYHYATRFAKHLPVLFFQHRGTIPKHVDKPDVVVLESDIPGLDIIYLAVPISASQVLEINSLIRHRGFKRPLIWIYDPVNYWPLIDSWPAYFRVYHATEDYFTDDLRGHSHEQLRQLLKKLLRDTDLVVAVSEKVLENIIVTGCYTGATLLSENGCDYSFFQELKIAHNKQKIAPSSKPIVIYQGGINIRLDYKLIISITREMPEYQFLFIGNRVSSADVEYLQRLSNVKFMDAMSPEILGMEMFNASVGIIPFHQHDLMYNSLPLKAFEYVACGLPVVSIPIHALEKYSDNSDIFRFARTSEEFINAIRSLAEKRLDPERIQQSERLAQINSYDARFEKVASSIADHARVMRSRREPLNIALLYDQNSCHVGTIKEHLDSFRRHSAHTYTYLPASAAGIHSILKKVGMIDLAIFDAVVLHCSVRLSLNHHLADCFAKALESFHGIKVLFIQDEYDAVECTRSWMDRLKFDVVYTCIPLEEREKVYPSARYPATDFLPTLTGYVPESGDMDRFIQRLEDRQHIFVYRGRELPPIYGKLGHEKSLIGVEVLKRAKQIALSVDIACDADSRIYGDDWYRFLASGRATLGTESGANLFDFDGSLAKRIELLQRQCPNVTFEDIWEQVLKPYDGVVRMNQISPKIFEAIRLRTALVLFDGDYSGVVKPGIHFIPLKKDFSNFSEVVAKVMDDSLIREMTERAWQDIIASGQYSYRHFVEGVDRDLRERCLRRQHRQLMYGVVFTEGAEGKFRQCLPVIPLDLPCSENVLDSRMSFEQMQEKYARNIPAKISSLLFIASRVSDNYLLTRYSAAVAQSMYKVVVRRPHLNRWARWLYCRLPERVRDYVLMLIAGIR